MSPSYSLIHSSTLFSIGYFTNFSLLYSVVNLYVYVTLSLQLENKLLEARNLSYLSFSLFSSYDMWFTNLWDQWISRVFHLFLFCNHSYCSCYSRVIPSNVILHGNLCKEKKKKRLTLVGRRVLVIFSLNIFFLATPCWLYRTPMALLDFVWKLQYSVYMSWSSRERPFIITSSVV